MRRLPLINARVAYVPNEAMTALAGHREIGINSRLNRSDAQRLPGTEAAVGVNAAANDGRAQKNGQQSFAASRLPGLFGLLELFPRLIIGVGLNGRHLRGNVGGDEGSALHGLRKIHRLHDGRRLLAVHAALRHESARLLKGRHLLHGLRLLGPIARHDRRHLLRIIKRLSLRRKGAGRNCAIGGREGSVCGLTVWRRNGAGCKAGGRSALIVEIRILLHRRSPSFCEFDRISVGRAAGQRAPSMARRRSSTRRSIRETCIWETPSRLAVSRWPSRSS